MAIRSFGFFHRNYLRGLNRLYEYCWFLKFASPKCKVRLENKTRNKLIPQLLASHGAFVQRKEDEERPVCYNLSNNLFNRLKSDIGDLLSL